MNEDYDPADDARKCYDVAIAAKKARGDKHYPIPFSQKPATLELPWPSSLLSPNARLHWAAKAKAVKEARSVAGWAAVSTRELERFKGKALKVTAVFCPPDARRRDRDNMLASIKPYLDGIADVIGVDDSNFELTISKAEPVKHGAVKITLEVA